MEDVSDEDAFEKKTEKYDEIFVHYDKIKDKIDQMHSPTIDAGSKNSVNADDD